MITRNESDQVQLFLVDLEKFLNKPLSNNSPTREQLTSKTAANIATPSRWWNQ